MKQKIKNVLRGVKQRWGGFKTKSGLWDKEYASGRWDHCEHTPHAPIYDYVHKYCRSGSVLDLGCGSGNTGNELDVGLYHDYTGVDISRVALWKAARRSTSLSRERKNRYVHADIFAYVPTQKHDVVLFRETIYYIPLGRVKAMLERYSQYLTTSGVLVVDVSGTKEGKKKKLLDIIHLNFAVLEMDSQDGTGEFIVVFRPVQNRFTEVGSESHNQASSHRSDPNAISTLGVEKGANRLENRQPPSPHA